MATDLIDGRWPRTALRHDRSMLRSDRAAERAEQVGRYLGERAKNRLAVRDTDMIVGNSIPRYRLFDKIRVIGRTFEAHAQRGERAGRRAAWGEPDIGQLTGLVGEPIERVPDRARGQPAVNFPVKVGIG